MCLLGCDTEHKALSLRMQNREHLILHTTNMRNDNVIPFPKRPPPPSEAELEQYRFATRNWHPEFRRRLFPEHYELELKYAED